MKIVVVKISRKCQVHELFEQKINKTLQKKDSLLFVAMFGRLNVNTRSIRLAPLDEVPTPLCLLALGNDDKVVLKETIENKVPLVEDYPGGKLNYRKNSAWNHNNLFNCVDDEDDESYEFAEKPNYYKIFNKEEDFLFFAIEEFDGDTVTGFRFVSENNEMFYRIKYPNGEAEFKVRKSYLLKKRKEKIENEFFSDICNKFFLSLRCIIFYLRLPFSFF